MKLYVCCSEILSFPADPFGNYLCQKLLEYSTDDQRNIICESVAQDLVNISLNMHGTRAVQKMIDFLSSQRQASIAQGAIFFNAYWASRLMLNAMFRFVQLLLH